MTIDEIKKGAPDGATHYEITENEIFYWKIEGENMSCWNHWFACYYEEYAIDRILKPL